MDFDAIDRAFAPQDPGRNPMHDVSNAAPLPRKRPTAKPASRGGGAGTTSAPRSVGDSPTDQSAPGPLPSATTTAQPQQQQQRETSPTAANQNQSGGGNNANQLGMQINEIQGKLQGLQQQQQQGAASGVDPQQQQQIMQRMTSLMTELQSMMAQMANLNIQQAQQQQQQQAQQQPPQQPQDSTFGVAPRTFGGPDRSSSGGGLRTNAEPFTPGNFGGGGGFGGGGRGGRGGGGYSGGNSHQGGGRYNGGGSNGASGYAGGSSGGGAFAAANNGVHWGNFNATPSARPSSCVTCLVEFKRGRMKRYESDVFIAPGNYIVVEGDRGEDCGLVVHTQQRAPDSNAVVRQETLDGVNIDNAKVKPETGRVRRVASEDEVERLHGEIASLERHALKTCRDRVEQMGIDMEVVDCEYQFDRKKITFFFDSSRAVDFRELTKDLFKHFGARIWLENINSKVKNVVPDGALSHADKLLYAERGLRPPRR